MLFWNSSLNKHLVQALPPVFTLQCLTGKADKNNKYASLTTLYNVCREIQVIRKL